MSSTAQIPDASRVYEHDYYAWAREQALALRERQIELLDFAHLAEEVDALADRDRRELRSRLMRILVHLLKWRFQAARRSRSWAATLDVQRTEIETLLESSPSLRGELPALIARAFTSAQRVAGREMRLERDEWTCRFPVECPWSVEQILDVEFYPHAPK
ncbi:MAG: DUF29 domain-containing protein [Candidatus Binataceae bacterium]